MSIPQVSIPGVRFIGSGDIPVIVIHGWMAGSELFDPMIPYLDHARFTYALMDCRGYGARLNERGPFTVVQIAQDALALADEMQWATFHLLGHSMAGMAAQWLMSSCPERLESAVLLATVPASGAAVSEERRALLTTALHDQDARLALIDTNVGHTRPEKWLREVLGLSLRTTRPDVMLNYMESWIGDDFAHQVHGAKVPTLVLIGDLDPGATSVTMGQTVMRWLPNAQLKELLGVGHYPMRENPRPLVEAMEAFVSQVRDRVVA
ncbi:alpha/beta hydrolase [Pseudomonas sp. JM0905a]|uniref:alpha/beta fold hydrolase n=1 Tax=Pseudomonas sp. JM0905a TaxID=2772484 RepID=UPI0016862273|nr:alpha/beta hydrolase [Pseudomonas sp. JM0905a]MBD2837866.1 alpha/beta hydrolase [Pseudomonas sp. JM0905a]